jgi:hypothetical protein
MVDIRSEIALMRACLDSIGPIPATLEMHPTTLRRAMAALPLEVATDPSLFPYVHGLRLVPNPRLKPWACVVRDGRGGLIEVLRVVDLDKNHLP